MKKLFLVLFLLISASVSAQNVPEISTDRPDQTESPDVIPLKHTQFEAGVSYENYSYDFFIPPGFGLTPGTFKVSMDSYTTPDLLIRYGLQDDFELRFGTSYTSSKVSMTPVSPDIEISTDSPIFGPLMFGGKLSIAEEGEILPKTSLLVEVEMPALTNDNNKSYFDPTIKFCFTNGLSSNADLSYNLGMQFDNNGKTQTTGLYTVSLGLDLSDKIGMYGEVYGFIPFDGGESLHYLDAGFTYLVKNNLQLDISGGYGLQKSVTDYYLAAGVSFRIPN